MREMEQTRGPVDDGPGRAEPDVFGELVGMGQGSNVTLLGSVRVDSRFAEAEEMARRVREHVIRMAANGGCFLGSALSCTDLMVYLYAHFLRLSRDGGEMANLDDDTRDYFFLSKGHAVPALYGTLAEVGMLAHHRLDNHLSIHDCIYWHPNRGVPGVEFHSGSLGHLLPVAVGVAMDCKMRNAMNRVVVLTGDGELNEGTIWEACLVASAYGLDNLTVVVDRNQFQANARTEDLIPLDSLHAKFKAFGWRPARIDGHDFQEMDERFSRLPFSPGMPSAIVADTVRGQGLPSMARRVDRWFVSLATEEAEALIEELHNGSRRERTHEL